MPEGLALRGGAGFGRGYRLRRLWHACVFPGREDHGLGAELNPLTENVLRISDFLRAQWLAVLVGSIALWFGLVAAASLISAVVNGR